jgi:hypothetical protein
MILNRISKKMGYESVDWIHLALGRDQWQVKVEILSDSSSDKR